MGVSNNGTIDLTLMDKVFEKYAEQEGALIPILQAAQSTYGYLPKEVLNLIADRLEVSLGKVYGVATFYAQFYLERRGRHVLKLCDGTACHVKGSLQVLQTLMKLLKLKPGQTSRDRFFSLEVVACMGACGLAPVVNLNGEFHAKVTSKRVAQIVAACREREAQHVEV